MGLTGLEQFIIGRKDKALSVSCLSKAMAYYLCRELIEDLHSEYKIPDDRIEDINKRAVNRAALIVDFFEDVAEDRLAMFSAAHSLYAEEWDEPERTEEIRRMEDTIDELVVMIKEKSK